MYRFNKQILLTAALLLTLTACGGGGGGGGGNSTTPTDPTTVFSLFPSGYFSAGYNETYTFTGTDTGGGVFTGSYSIQTQTQSAINGVPAIPFAVSLQLNNTASGAFISSIGTGYYSTDTTNPENLGFTSTTFGTTTVSATTTVLPTTATIGSFGSIGTYIDNTGDTDVDTWRLDDGGNGNAKLVFSTTTTDQFGTISFTSEESYLIAPNGNRISIAFRLFDTNAGITINLSGNKN
jgi:hypothetical protein